jgi:hypothetical protein
MALFKVEKERCPLGGFSCFDSGDDGRIEGRVYNR